MDVDEFERGTDGTETLIPDFWSVYAEAKYAGRDMRAKAAILAALK